MRTPRLALALGVASLALGQTAALAGGIAPAIVEPEVVVEETSSSSAAGVIVPIMLLLLIAVAVSASGGSDAPVEVIQ